MARLTSDEFNVIASAYSLPPVGLAAEGESLRPAQRSQLGLAWETARLACRVVPLTAVKARDDAAKAAADRQQAIDVAKAA